ncbi:hypothetical protein [Elioraea sp.]|uniref:hypothetical protein n=1 Tax=Elioraea sp. TaxID=2185103 RepID=UPI002615C309|nr:hypothetical protein [Elioraea sp.]
MSSTGAQPERSVAIRTAFGDISSSSVIRPRAGTKLRARAPVDHTTSTVRAARSTVAGAAMARCATIDCPGV